MNALFCGLDVHRSGASYATVVDEFGAVVKEKKIANDSILEFVGAYHPKRVAMEASTSITPIYRKLVREGYDVLVSHPTKMRVIAESKIKTDRVDARALAELLRLDALPTSYMPDESLASLRDMVRRRAFLVRERSKLKVKVRDYLAYNGIQVSLEEGLFARKGVEWLRSLRLEPVDMYLRLMHSLNVEILTLSGDLKRMAPEDEDVKLLMTIPGIGYYSALLVKSEVGSVERFPDGEHLCSYAGLVPSVRAAGGHAARYGSITKQGSRWLRWIMVEAAHSHAKHDTSISRFYHSLAQRKGKQVAMVATARKLQLLCCYSVLKNRRAYSDQASS
jgi:transposase